MHQRALLLLRPSQISPNIKSVLETSELIVKWLYAFNIVPATRLDPTVLVRDIPDSTACPYTAEAVVTKQSGV